MIRGPHVSRFLRLGAFGSGLIFRTAGSGPTWQWTFNSNNHLSADVIYDAAGNTIADPSNMYTYDAENRVISVYNQTTGRWFWNSLSTEN